MLKRKKGFTLIELLVVIIIVSILAAVSIPMMAANTIYARGSEGAAIAGAIRTAQRIYYSENPGIGYIIDEADLDDLGIDWDVEYAGKFYDCVDLGGTRAAFTANVFTTDAAYDDEWVEIGADGEWHANSTGVRP